jgi:preprotein translocase subunit YajC
MYGAIFAIFYFVLMRPQQQQRKKHEEEIRNVKKGDRIVTSGGIIGEVIFLKDEEITIRSGESRLVIERGRIARIATPTAPADGA